MALSLIYDWCLSSSSRLSQSKPHLSSDDPFIPFNLIYNKMHNLFFNEDWFTPSSYPPTHFPLPSSPPKQVSSGSNRLVSNSHFTILVIVIWMAEVMHSFCHLNSWLFGPWPLTLFEGLRGYGFIRGNMPLKNDFESLKISHFYFSFFVSHFHTFSDSALTVCLTLTAILCHNDYLWSLRNHQSK